MRIAITSRFIYSFFANGLNQNIVLLYELLEDCGFDVFFLDFTDEKLGLKFESHELLEGKKVINWWSFEPKKQHVDILLCPGISANSQMRDALKAENENCKICALHYGNNLITSIHELFFSKSPKMHCMQEDRHEDFVLYSPHYGFAKEYMECNTKSKSIEFPYIWSPKFIETEARSLNVNPRYTPVARPNIAVVEPCLNISKTNLIPLLIIMQTLRERDHCFNEAYIFSSKFKEGFESVSKHLNSKTILAKHNGRIFFDPREKILKIFERDNPIMLSHQFYNELNYVYLEALYYDFPLVHNSNPFKEAGYFYEGFNIKEGARQVITATEKHNDLIKESRYKNEEIIHRYSPEQNKRKITSIMERIHND